jgi:hypothetical protein
MEEIEDTNEPTSILDVFRDMLATDRVFYSTLRFAGSNYNTMIREHYAQNAAMLRIAQTLVSMSLARETRRVTAAAAAAPLPTQLQRDNEIIYTMNIPLGSLAQFLDPVSVTPSAEQITSATETFHAEDGTTCSICQEEVTTSTRIRQCGHRFHATCISQWFSLNPRCPMCRTDIREHGQTTYPEGDDEDQDDQDEHDNATGYRMHPDT